MIRDNPASFQEFDHSSRNHLTNLSRRFTHVSRTVIHGALENEYASNVVAIAIHR